MIARAGAVNRDGAVDQVDGDVMATDLGRENAEQMQRVGVIGLQRQRLAIQRFSLREPARLMMRKAGGKLAGDARVRCRRAARPAGRLGGTALSTVHILPLRNECRKASISPALGLAESARSLGQVR